MIFDRFKELHIAVIGDLILDEYIYGSVNRLSPEAPIHIVDLTKMESKAGGAANVCLNLKNLGVNSYLIGVTGSDNNGHKLEEIIRSGLEPTTVNIIKDSNRITTTKTRVLAHNQHVVRIDHEQQDPIPGHVTQQIFAAITSIHQENKLDAIILQDYEKGIFHEGNIGLLITHINDLGIKIIVDPKDKNFWLYNNVDLIKPNRKEAEKAMGLKINMDEQSLDDAANILKKKLNTRSVIITLSEHGVYVNCDQNKIWQRSSVLDVVDVCGAGDAVVSIVAAAYSVGLTVEEIASLSNLSGAIVCGVRGVAAVDLDQLKQAYLNRSN